MNYIKRYLSNQLKRAACAVFELALWLVIDLVGPIILAIILVVAGSGLCWLWRLW